MFLLFDDLGFQELLVIGVAGVLFFGKRLPEVAAQAGAQLAKFRRALADIRHDTNVDAEVRRLRRTIEDAVPRDIALGDVARLAQKTVEGRLQEARREIESGLGPSPSEALAAAAKATEAPLTTTPPRETPAPATTPAPTTTAASALVPDAPERTPAPESAPHARDPLEPDANAGSIPPLSVPRARPH